MFIVMYRSDTRPPEEMFKQGFQAKKMNQALPLKTDKPFEASNDAVSLTRKLEAAPAFPLHATEGAKRRSWLYVVAVNTEHNDFKSVDLYSKSLTDQPKAYQCLTPSVEWAKEHIVSEVPPTHILYAVPLEREGHTLECNDDTYVYTRFRLTGMPIFNRESTNTIINNPDIAKKCIEIITFLMQTNNDWVVIPRPESGTKDERKAGLSHTAFFSLNKWEDNFKKNKPSIRPSGRKCNSKFFESNAYMNDAGVMFSSKEQLYKENANFFRSVRNNAFNQHIAKNEKQLLWSMAESATYYYVNCKEEYMPYAEMLAKEIKSFIR